MLLKDEYKDKLALNIGVKQIFEKEKIEDELQDDVEVLQKYINTYENKDYIEVEQH